MSACYDLVIKKTDIDDCDLFNDIRVLFQRVERSDHHVVEHAEPARRRRGQQAVRSRVMPRRPHAHERVPKLPGTHYFSRRTAVSTLIDAGNGSAGGAERGLEGSLAEGGVADAFVLDFLAGHAESLLHVRRERHGLPLHQLAVEFIQQLEVPQRVSLQNLLLPRDREARVVADRPLVDLRVENLQNRGDPGRRLPGIGALRAGRARNVQIAVGVVQDDRAELRMHAVEDLPQLMTLLRGKGFETGKRGNLRLVSLLRRESGVWCCWLRSEMLALHSSRRSFAQSKRPSRRLRCRHVFPALFC